VQLAILRIPHPQRGVEGSYAARSIEAEVRADGTPNGERLDTALPPKAGAAPQSR